MWEYLPWTAGAIGALSCLIFVWGFHLVTAEQQVVGGINRKSRNKKSDASPLVALAAAVGRPFGGPVLALMGGRGIGYARRAIDSAGRPQGMTVEFYARRKAGELILFGVPSLIFLLDGSYMIGGALLVFGLLLTDAQLFIKARQRRDAIQTQLPDFLDVLSVTVTAGLGFRHALARVTENMPGALADEFRASLQQMELGMSRRDAFEDLQDRINVKAISQFVTALLQAEELGSPLSTALNEISTDIRRESAQWARRKAQKITPRITIVTTFMMLPALMLLILSAMFFGSDLQNNLSKLFG